MSDDPRRPKLVRALPASPVLHETIRKLGESDRTVGTMPIKSRFNEVVTEFLLIVENGTYALAFDPETEQWQVLAHRLHDEMREPAIEEELMELLREWRKEHVLEYLVENDLIPHFVLEDEERSGDPQ